MPRTTGGLPMAGLTIDRGSATALHRQLYEAIRSAILARRLRAGRRLPSTRVLASELQLSRNTVVNAIDQLRAEGYLEGRSGSGTYVTRSIPDEALRAERREREKPDARTAVTASRRASDLGPTLRAGAAAPRPFGIGPATDLFPLDRWARIAARQWRRAGAAQLGGGDPAGHRPLREAIAAYAADMRGVNCEADQVVVVNGGQEALYLAAHVLTDRGDSIWVEDPSYVGARRVFESAGLRVVPVPVDVQGLSVQAGAARGRPRAIYVSPSHQYPLGITMTATRRIELLRYAGDEDVAIIEDDYDSEYRYGGRSIASLQGLDTQGRVVYVGTLSKVLVPSIRLGYIIAPESLVESFIRLRSIVARHTATTEQAIAAEFIASGHLERHVRRMRSVYAERQQVLVDSAARHLTGLLRVAPSAAGMHLIARLATPIREDDAVRNAAGAAIDVAPLGPYAIEARLDPALLLGYAAWTPDAIRRGVRHLASALEPLARRPATRRR